MTEQEEVLVKWTQKTAAVAWRKPFARISAGRRPDGSWRRPNLAGGILLGQIVWLALLSRQQRPDVVTIDGVAWVVRARHEWGELTLTINQVDRQMAKLAEIGLIIREHGVSRLPQHRGALVCHVRPDADTITRCLREIEAADRLAAARIAESGAFGDSAHLTSATPRQKPRTPSFFCPEVVGETAGSPSAIPQPTPSENAKGLPINREVKRIIIREEASDDDSLVVALTAEGIQEGVAHNLVAQAAPGVVEGLLEAWRGIWKPAGKTVGYLVRAIERNFPVPPEIATKKRAEESAAAAQQESDQRAAEHQQQESRRAQALAALESAWQGMSDAQRAALDAEAAATLAPWLQKRLVSKMGQESLKAARWRLLAARCRV